MRMVLPSTPLAIMTAIGCTRARKNRSMAHMAMGQSR